MRKYAVEVIDKEWCYNTFDSLFEEYKKETCSNLFFEDSLPHNGEKYALECIVDHPCVEERVYIVSKNEQAFLMNERGLLFLDQEMDVDYIDLRKNNKTHSSPEYRINEDAEWTKVCSGTITNMTPFFIYGADFPISDSISKTQIIERLKFYLEDYESIESDGSMRKVINWFVDCTPEYNGWFV